MGSRSRKRAKERGTSAVEAALPERDEGIETATAEPAEAPSVESPSLGEGDSTLSDPEAASRDGDAPPPLTAEQVELLYLFLLWVARYGEPPEPEDWAETADWPRPVEVDRAFPDYGWDDLWYFTDLDHAELFARQDALAEERKTAKEAEASASGLRRRLEKETGRLPELKRQLDAARERREAAVGEAKDLRRDLERLRGERDAERARAETAEAAVREAAERVVGAADVAPDARLAEADRALEAERVAGERARGERDRLHDELGRLGDDHERLREHMARLEKLLEERAAAAAEGPADEGESAEAEPEPRTVLGAVQRASRRAGALRYAPAAFESAEQSPFTRPGMILETLDRLDALAARYADPKGMGGSMTQIARELGLLGWRGGVSETARTRNASDYTVAFEGERLPMGPHVALGTGSGSGAVARIYLAAADGSGPTPRGLIVAHVGRHLPDSTTA